MCRLYRGQTTVLFAGEDTYLPVVEKGYSLQHGIIERAGFIVGFAQWACPNHTDGGHNPPQEKYVIPVSFCGLSSKRANLYRGLNGQSVPCARHEEANRPRSPAPPPPHNTLHNSLLFIYIPGTTIFLPPSSRTQHGECQHCNKNSSYNINHHDESKNQYIYLVRGTTYIYISKS